jgi:hypothetical protein
MFLEAGYAGKIFPSPDTLKFSPYFRFSLSASASLIVRPNFVPLTPIMISLFSESVLEGILRATCVPHPTHEYDG